MGTYDGEALKKLLTKMNINYYYYPYNIKTQSEDVIFFTSKKTGQDILKQGLKALKKNRKLLINSKYGKYSDPDSIFINKQNTNPINP